MQAKPRSIFLNTGTRNLSGVGQSQPENLHR